MRDWKVIISSLILGASIVVSSIYFNHSIIELTKVLRGEIHIVVDHNLGYNE